MTPREEVLCAALQEALEMLDNPRRATREKIDRLHAVLRLAAVLVDPATLSDRVDRAASR